MAARLTIYPPDQPVRSFLLEAQDDYRIGRAESCEIRISDARISRIHARLAHVEGDWRVIDLHSKNGVTVDGQTCLESRLNDGAWISFGGLLANFCLVNATELTSERRRRETRWGSTVDISRQLDPAAGIDKLLRKILDAVLELTGTERGFIMLPDDAGRLAIRARASRSEWPGGKDDFPGSLGTVERVLASRRPVIACDVRADALLARRPSVEAGMIRALLCIPLVIGDRLSGVIYLDSRADGKVFTELDLELLEAFASHAALVLGVASLRDDFAELASLLPAEMSRRPRAGALVRRLTAALPDPVSSPDIAGHFA
jgi:pSer/pThr/pTyr-binding forkhead associated (FHA) protein